MRMKSTRALLMVFCAMSGLAYSQEIRQGNQTLAIPPKLFSLEDLGKIENSRLDALTKTEVLIRWLTEERKQPTKTRVGITGGPVDSNYIQAQIIETLLGHADLRAIKWLCESKGLANPLLRDQLYMALDDIDDLICKAAIVRVLRRDKNPYLRERAAARLGFWEGGDVQAVLSMALHDPFRLRYVSTHGGPGKESPVRDYYPVRRTAAESLSNLRDPARRELTVRWAENWKKVLRRRLAGYDEFVASKRADLIRLLKIANQG